MDSELLIGLGKVAGMVQQHRPGLRILRLDLEICHDEVEVVVALGPGRQGRGRDP